MIPLFSTRDSRDIAFQQLQNALASKDLELARLQQIHVQLVAEVIFHYTKVDLS